VASVAPANMGSAPAGLHGWRHQLVTNRPDCRRAGRLLRVELMSEPPVSRSDPVQRVRRALGNDRLSVVGPVRRSLPPCSGRCVRHWPRSNARGRLSRALQRNHFRGSSATRRRCRPEAVGGRTIGAARRGRIPAEPSRSSTNRARRAPSRPNETAVRCLGAEHLIFVEP